MFLHLTDFLEPGEPGPAPAVALSSEDQATLADLRSRLRAGDFPELMDFNPAFGSDLSACSNVRPGGYALGNDGAGNHYVAYADKVDLWCHDEGGYMQNFDFRSVEDLMACLVLAHRVKAGAVAWDSVSEMFEAEAETVPGWEWFQENVEEYLEDPD